MFLSFVLFVELVVSFLRKVREMPSFAKTLVRLGLLGHSANYSDETLRRTVQLENLNHASVSCVFTSLSSFPIAFDLRGTRTDIFFFPFTKYSCCSRIMTKRLHQHKADTTIAMEICSDVHPQVVRQELRTLSLPTAVKRGIRVVPPTIVPSMAGMSRHLPSLGYKLL